MVLGVLAGLAIAVAGTRLLGGDDDGASGEINRRSLEGEVNAPQDLLSDVPVPAGAGAGSAEAALSGFLAAEVEADYEASFGFLSEADRQAYGSPAGWVSAHASTLAPILDFQLDEVADDPERAAITARITFEPGLDQVVGLTPGQADVTWTVVLGTDEGWGIALEESSVAPIYPDESGATPAAQQWVDARQACTDPPNERDGLVGVPALADDLCDAADVSAPSDPAALDELAVTPVATAYGPEAASAARVLRIEGTVELGVVLVPIGDQWTVIGVVA